MSYGCAPRVHFCPYCREGVLKSGFEYHVRSCRHKAKHERAHGPMEIEPPQSRAGALRPPEKRVRQRPTHMAGTIRRQFGVEPGISTRSGSRHILGPPALPVVSGSDQRPPFAPRTRPAHPRKQKCSSSFGPGFYVRRSASADGRLNNVKFPSKGGSSSQLPRIPKLKRQKKPESERKRKRRGFGFGFGFGSSSARPDHSAAAMGGSMTNSTSLGNSLGGVF